MPQYSDKQVLDALHQDPFYEAEKIMGRSYKEDQEVSQLGLLLHLKKHEALQTMLESRGDTNYSMPVEDYIQIIETHGFQQVYSLPFDSYSEYSPTRINETLYIFFQEPALLLVFDTYRTHVNGGHLYYNWLPHDYTQTRHVVESGSYFFLDPKDKEESDARQKQRFSMEPSSPEHKAAWDAEEKIVQELQQQKKYGWSGSHDCRVALIMHIDRLKQHGQFIPWIEPPFLWILHHMDTKAEKYDYRSISLNRLAQCPDFVQKAINLDHWKNK